MRVFTQLMMRKKIPSIYKVLDWIQSSGTQYIDTDYTAKTNTVFEVDCAFTDLSVGRNGSMGASGGNIFRYYFGVASSKFIGANSTSYNHSIQDADTQRHTFAIKQDGVYIDNINVYSSSASYGNTTKIYLFAINDTGATGGVDYYCKQKMYGSKIWDNGTLVRNLIPVRRTTDNVCGMYDTVSKTFFTNAGTGKFIGSDEIPLTVVGSPTITDGVVSGFTTSDYLQNTSFPNVSFKGKIRTKTNSTTTGFKGIFRISKTSSPYNTLTGFKGIFRISKTSSPYNTFSVENHGTETNRIYRFNENDNFNVAESIYNLTLVNIWIDYDFEYDISAKTLKVSATNIENNTVLYSKSYTDCVLNANRIQLGRIDIGFDGSIDLNNSYLIIDGTKYIFTV